MSTIANLDVNLFAHTKKFDNPLKSSGKTFSLFSGGISAGIAAIPGPAALAAGAIAGVTTVAAGAAAGVGALAIKVSSLSSEIKDFERFGLSAEKSFGQFKILASDAGLELEDFADLAKDLGVRIGEANLDGGGEIFDVFKRLGLDVKELAGLAPEQQLEAYAEAISKVENETERLAITDILLSDAGTKALGVLKQGTAGFTAAAQEAEKFGLNVTAVDAAQLQSASKAMGRIGLLAEGLFNTIAIEGAPTLEAFASMFTDSATGMVDLSTAVEAGFKILNAGIGFALDGWNLFVGGVNTGTGIVVDQIAGIIQILAQAEKAMVSIGGQKFNFGVEDLANQAKGIAVALKTSGVEQFKAGISGAASQGFQDRLDEIRQQAEETASKPLVAPTPIEPFVPPEAESKLKFGVGDVFNSVLDSFAGFVRPGDAEAAAARPSVSALAFGSSDTQSFLNQLNQQDKDDKLQKQLEESRKAEKENFDRNIQAIRSIGSAISNAAGVIVPL